MHFITSVLVLFVGTTFLGYLICSWILTADYAKLLGVYRSEAETQSHLVYTLAGHLSDDRPDLVLSEGQGRQIVAGTGHPFRDRPGVSPHAGVLTDLLRGIENFGWAAHKRLLHETPTALLTGIHTALVNR